MAVLTNEDYFEMRDFAFSVPALKANIKELMNDPALSVNKTTLKAAFQAIEDEITAISASTKTAVEAELGGTITNLQAKDLGRVYYWWKAQQ